MTHLARDFLDGALHRGRFSRKSVQPLELLEDPHAYSSQAPSSSIAEANEWRDRRSTKGEWQVLTNQNTASAGLAF